MEYNVSPSVFADEKKTAYNAYVDERYDELEKSIDEKEQECEEKAEKMIVRDKSFKAYLGTFIRGTSKVLYALVFVAAIAVGIGFAIFVAQSEWSKFDDTERIVLPICAVLAYGFGVWIAAKIVKALGGFIYGGLFGLILCPIAYPIYCSVCNKKNKDTEMEYSELEKELERVTDQMEKSCEADVDKRMEKTQQEIAQYTESFEREAQSLSHKYSSSPLTNEIVEWVAGDYLKVIKNADRASHIENINVSFDFAVGKYEIKQKYGAYSFNEHRCETLPNVITQTALAMAIASEVKTNISNYYEKDESGTEYNVNVTYDYIVKRINDSEDCDYVIVSFSYTAPNGNYKPVQKW